MRMPNRPLVALAFLHLALTLVSQTRGEETDGTFSMEDFSKLAKIDLHFHMGAADSELVKRALNDKFRFLNIVVDSQGPLMLRQRHRTAFILRQANPKRIAVASAFSLEGWEEPDWAEKAIAHLDSTFEKGAVAIKVWKNIGMVHRDASGKLVMIDDPRFDPVFEHLIARGIVVIGHLGEPKNCGSSTDVLVESLNCRGDVPAESTLDFGCEYPQHQRFI